MMPSMLVTVREVARVLNIGSSTVRRWGNQGILKTYRISKRGDRRFGREDIDHLLKELNNSKGDIKKACLADNGLLDKD